MVSPSQIDQAGTKVAYRKEKNVSTLNLEQHYRTNMDFFQLTLFIMVLVTVTGISKYNK